MNQLSNRCDNSANDTRHPVHETAIGKRQSQRIELFAVGESDDLATESAIERANQALMKFLDERGRQAQPGKGTSLEDVRRQLDL